MYPSIFRMLEHILDDHDVTCVYEGRYVVKNASDGDPSVADWIHGRYYGPDDAAVECPYAASPVVYVVGHDP